MKSSIVVKRYQDLYDDVISKIEHLNKTYCTEFNGSNPMIYKMLNGNFAVGDAQYLIFNQVGPNYSGISTVEMKNVAIQQHFNYLAIIAHAIESKIYDILIVELNDVESKCISYDSTNVCIEDCCIMVNSLVGSSSETKKNFLEDLTTEEQLHVYYQLFKQS
jgi:hypothetical protein